MNNNAKKVPDLPMPALQWINKTEFGNSKFF